MLLDADIFAYVARTGLPPDLQSAGYLALLRDNATATTPELNAIFLLSIHGNFTDDLVFSTDDARATGALAAEAGLDAMTVIAAVQRVHDDEAEYQIDKIGGLEDSLSPDHPNPFCWAHELINGFCLWGFKGTNRKPQD